MTIYHFYWLSYKKDSNTHAHKKEYTYKCGVLVFSFAWLYTFYETQSQLNVCTIYTLYIYFVCFCWNMCMCIIFMGSGFDLWYICLWGNVQPFKNIYYFTHTSLENFWNSWCLVFLVFWFCASVRAQRNWTPLFVCRGNIIFCKLLRSFYCLIYNSIGVRIYPLGCSALFVRIL